MNLSIIVASSGRPTLERAIQSCKTQMGHGDELLVSVQSDCPWGHKARNQLMPAARGHCLLFMDDDDMYVPGALDLVRERVSEHDHRVHMFKMRYANGRELWQHQEVLCGNVSTIMFAVPNIFHDPAYKYGLGQARWGDRYEGDFDFISECCELLDEPVWHEEVIGLVRP